MNVQLWRENKLSQEWALDSLEIARRFWDSPFAQSVAGPLTLEGALRLFLTEREERGGLNSTWAVPEDPRAEDTVFDAIFEDTLAARPWAEV